jgi:haloalkane dehalogenase
LTDVEAIMLHRIRPEHPLTRRQALSHAAWLATAGTATSLLVGCGTAGETPSAPGIERPPPAPPPPPTVVATPPERFDALLDYPWAPRYVTVAGHRMHYIDVGPVGARHTMLCLHGQPTWSYLYRKMIPVFLAAGHRVIAPDWIGFGKSDKLVADAAYTFTFHRDCLLSFIRQLDLQRVTLVVQDWGGLLGLTVPPEMPERFERLLIMNTTFATGAALSPTQTNWEQVARARRERWSATTDVDVMRIMLSASQTATPVIAAAYDAPYPGPLYEAGARRFPVIVPISPNEDGAAISRDAMAWWGTRWSGQTFMAIGMRDELLGPDVMRVMQTLIRGCPAPMEVADAGHFIQEDAGTRVAEAAMRVFT